MKQLFAGLCALALLSLISPLPSVQAQTAEATTKSTVPLWYDITKEVTLTGTVSSVVEKTTPEMKTLGGSHLILETISGTVDASLGKFAMSGEGALSVTPGQRVQVTGVMKTIGDKHVLVTRLVLANGHVYQTRNEHGFARTPATRNATSNSEAKGGQQ